MRWDMFECARKLVTGNFKVTLQLTASPDPSTLTSLVSKLRFQTCMRIPRRLYSLSGCSVLIVMMVLERLL
ncbi:hypothetical protein L218DRAFT_366462 [Marasmius fiardii PR-910]|nr:hypothetical protein L218DRAFT_366462 [Marasmius fiardii PR-910]